MVTSHHGGMVTSCQGGIQGDQDCRNVHIVAKKAVLMVSRVVEYGWVRCHGNSPTTAKKRLGT